MKKVAVFGNTGGGKSTQARKLAEFTRLPHCPLDTIQYRPGGAEVPRDEYLRAHAELLTRDAWIIDGYGCRKSAWERIASADTLICIDLPLLTHFRWVTKRLFKGIFETPEGSPTISSTLSGYRVLWLCHRYLTPEYRELVAQARHHKRVHKLTSSAEIGTFLAAVEAETRSN